MLHDILALREEAMKTLFVLEDKLILKNKSVEEIHKAKVRKLKKGKEDLLKHYQSERKLSETALENEIKGIQGKIHILEDKITQIKEQYNSTKKIYYDNKFEDLYEDDVSQDEIKLNQSHQELLTRVNDLKKKIAFWDSMIDYDKKKTQDKLKAEFEAKKAQAPKIKPKTAKKASHIPEKDEFEQFKEARLNEIETNWRQRLHDIMDLKAPLPQEDDPFYSEYQEFMGQHEIDVFNKRGGLMSHLISSRKDKEIDKAREQEIQEVIKLKEDEANRVKLLEKAKYGLSC